MNNQLLISLISCLGLTACATDSTLKTGVDDTCGNLKAIIADYATGFSDYRSGGSNYKLITIYRTKTELIEGHCEIWAWTGGDHAYVCFANAPTEEVAESRYQKSRSFLQQCLGNEWTGSTAEKSRDGEAIGVTTRFTSPAYPDLVVSAQNINAPGPFRVQRGNYVYIGSPERSGAQQ